MARKISLFLLVISVAYMAIFMVVQRAHPKASATVAAEESRDNSNDTDDTDFC